MKKKDVAYLILAIALFVVISMFAIKWYMDGSARYSSGRLLSPLTAGMALCAVLFQLRQMGIIGKNQSENGRREILIESLKRSAIMLAVVSGFDLFVFFFLNLYDKAFLLLFCLTFTAVVFFVYRVADFARFVRDSGRVADSTEGEIDSGHDGEDGDKDSSVSSGGRDE